MAKKLYVGNLSYNVTQEQLRTLFTQAGEVADVIIITDSETGRSKGFGFVEMATEEDAKKAISQFHDSVLDGRPLTVNEARPQEKKRFDDSYRSNRGGFSGGGSSSGGGGGSRFSNDKSGGNKRRSSSSGRDRDRDRRDRY